ncbi:hypothetical protein Ciccas_000035 [Cichlidogyrus casuarinus]|uniref:Uncharacterized protein n=1 Tax=Cichlidogyrus casuarinus TaxID=1844966 RepID=A0ABD2QP29_9PLAT
MAEGGLNHAIPDEWLQSGAYMAVLTESGGSSELVMEAATGKLFHKPTGHLVQLAGTGSVAEHGAAEEQQVAVDSEETVQNGEEMDRGKSTVVIDESTGQIVDIADMYPGVSVVNVSLGVCIVCKANGARFQVEHGGEGLTLTTLQTVLEMDDEA